MRSKMSAIGTSDSAFHDGNPSTGELGTIVTSDWLNAVQKSTMDLQDELLNVLAAASIANDPEVKTQILAAINKLSKESAQSIGFNFAGYGSSITADTSLSASLANHWFEFDAPGLTYTLPPISTVPPGSTFTFRGYIFGGKIKAYSSENLVFGLTSAANTCDIIAGETVTFASNGNLWYQVAGGIANDSFLSTKSTPGIQRLPGGWIIQCFSSNFAASGSDFVGSFPIAFPHACFHIALTSAYTPGSGVISYGSAAPISKTQYALRTSAGVGTLIIAIGY